MNANGNTDINTNTKTKFYTVIWLMLFHNNSVAYTNTTIPIIVNTTNNRNLMYGYIFSLVL